LGESFSVQYGMVDEEVLRTSTAQFPLCPGETRTRETLVDGDGAHPDRSVSNPPLATKLVEPPGSVVEVVEVVVVVEVEVLDVVVVCGSVVDVVVEVVEVGPPVGWNS